MVQGIDRAQCHAQAEYHAAFFSCGMVSKTYILLILKHFMYKEDWFLSMVFLQEDSGDHADRYQAATPQTEGQALQSE